MPTNLKSLLSRSRSRNELKKGEKDGDVPLEPGSHWGKDCSVCEGSLANTEPVNSHSLKGFDQFRHCDTSTRNSTHIAGVRNSGSCSHLVSSYSGRASHNSPGTAVGNDFTPAISTKNHKSSVQEGYNAGACVAMRKCETNLALSTLAGNSISNSCSQENGSTGAHCSSNGTSETAKVMKNKILSTSSSTLNCLLHSSSRSKLISSWNWKFSSANNSSSGSDYPDFSISHCPKVCDGMNETTDVQQMYKSQLSIPESGVGTLPMTPLNRLRRNVSINNTFYAAGANSSYSRSSSVASLWKEREEESPFTDILCRLCLCNVRQEETVEIAACSCRYCKDCITAYITFEIQEGADQIACPDASCEKQGALSFSELECLVSPAMIEKHEKFCMYREVEKNSQLMWCQNPGCETVCHIKESSSSYRLDGRGVNKSLSIICSTCGSSFCAECKLSCHPGTSCESFRKKLIKEGKLSLDDEELLSLECIKKCPTCHVLIEKDSGCAQMMCKKCKHVFCWYCLASLDDDFLLRHYDKGPCKNKLGHSRASVVWHRAQVIGIFAGFGVLVLLASPLLILAAPCLLCCRCRYCSKDSEDSPIPV